jgi:hypothetical protein
LEIQYLQPQLREFRQGILNFSNIRRLGIQGINKEIDMVG